MKSIKAVCLVLPNGSTYFHPAGIGDAWKAHIQDVMQIWSEEHPQYRPPTFSGGVVILWMDERAFQAVTSLPYPHFPGAEYETQNHRKH